MTFDKFAAWTYIITHQHGEDIVGFGSIFNMYLFKQAGIGVHGCFPQLFGVHFSQTFVSLRMDTVFASLAVFFDKAQAVFVCIAIFLYLSFRAQIHHGDAASLGVIIGFVVMMCLDVALA